MTVFMEMENLNYIIIDYRASDETIKELKNLGCHIIKTQPILSLYDEVRGHSDMQLHAAGDDIICAPEAYKYYKSAICGKKVVCGKSKLKPKYPYDIAYNTCRMGDYVICRENFTDSEILDRYRRMNLKILNTKQGYAKCSICVADKESAITADEGIYNLLIKCGMNVLKISSKGVDLYGMQGFIGGASGLINENLLAFNGDLKTHPDYENIKSFCRNLGVDTISLCSGPLKDIGSIIRF